MGFLGIGSNKKTVRDFNRRADLDRSFAHSNMRKSSNLSLDYTRDARDVADNAYEGANRSVDDLYGRQLATTQDRIQANTAMGQNAISQALMARGGDISGTGGVMNLQLNEQGNQAQSDAINQYKTMADRRNMIEKQRGDMMLARAMQGAEGSARRNTQNFQFASNQRNRGDMLEIQRRQANRQMLLDGISTVTGMFGGK